MAAVSVSRVNGGVLSFNPKADSIEESREREGCRHRVITCEAAGSPRAGQWYFKPRDPGHRLSPQSGPSEAVGISEGEPRYVERSVASYRLAVALGFGRVLAETHKAKIGNGFDVTWGQVSRMVEGKALNCRDVEVVALSEEQRAEMEAYVGRFGEGKEVVAFLAAKFGYPRVGFNEPNAMGKRAAVAVKPIFETLDPSNPRTQEDFCILQYLDALCGQADRHGSNFMLFEGGGAKGFDGDVAFGTGLVTLEKIVDDELCQLVKLPPVASQEIYEAFMGLTNEALVEILSPNLKAREIEGACIRLEEIQEHLKELAARGDIVEKGKWEARAEELKARFLAEPESSYLGRFLVKYPVAVNSKKFVFRLHEYLWDLMERGAPKDVDAAMEHMRKCLESNKHRIADDTYDDYKDFYYEIMECEHALKKWLVISRFLDSEPSSQEAADNAFHDYMLVPQFDSSKFVLAERAIEH